MKILKVGNGSNNYFGDFTSEEISKIKYNCLHPILNLFSGKSNIGDIRIDYSCKEATHNLDVFEYLEKSNEVFKTVVIDAPYNQKFADKYQELGKTQKQFIIFADVKGTNKLFNLIKEKINPIRIIIKSWNYYCPKGYFVKESYLCYAGGYRKPTILLILEKNNFFEVFNENKDFKEEK